MDYEKLDRLISNGDECYKHAINLICEQKFLEAKTYFFDAYNFYEKAENYALSYGQNSLASRAKHKKFDAKEEAENCSLMYYNHIPNELEL